MADRIDLNCDLGEEFDAWESGVDGLDTLLLDVVTSANVACGFHAGDERIMAAVCRAAARRGVAVGAHVSYLDRENFGRRFVDVPADVLQVQVTQQIELLQAIALGAGTRVAYVKPHGALYNTVVHHEQHARAVVAAITDLPVLGLPGSAVLAAASAPRAACGAGGVRRPRLPRRRDVGAAIGARGARHGRGRGGCPGAAAGDGRVWSLPSTAPRSPCAAESVCVHSDTPGAAVLARAVRTALVENGVAIRPFVA